MGVFTGFIYFICFVIPIVVIIAFAMSKIPKPQPAGTDEAFKAYCNTLNNTEMHNLIISGGKSADRFLAITSILNEASKRRIPTIVLHSGFAPFNQFSQNKYYDPCIGTDSDEIAEILTDAAVNALNIDSVVHSSIKLIVDILQVVNNGNITLSDVVGFPLDDVIGYLDDCKDNNKITDSQYDRFKQRYNNPAIKDNMLRIPTLFSKLKPLIQKNKTAQPINFQQVVDNKQILFYDLLTDTNVVLKELVFSAISKLTERSKFGVITEGISFLGKTDSKVDTVFIKNQNNITLIYSGEDVPTLTLQEEKTLETLTGGNSQLLLFAHTSGSSAEKWANHFGKENKTKITKTKQRSAFIGVPQGKGDSITTEKDYRFPPQFFMASGRNVDNNNNSVIWGLNEGECYFIKDSNDVLQTQVTGKGLYALSSVTPTQNAKLPKIALQPTPLLIDPASNWDLNRVAS